nr:MAG TPA_asm: hypothetical protein [Caudoviricetes sp.]
MNHSPSAKTISVPSKDGTSSSSSRTVTGS